QEQPARIRGPRDHDGCFSAHPLNLYPDQHGTYSLERRHGDGSLLNDHGRLIKHNSKLYNTTRERLKISIVPSLSFRSSGFCFDQPVISHYSNFIGAQLLDLLIFIWGGGVIDLSSISNSVLYF